MNSFRVYIFIVFITYSCGRNTTYIEKIDFTNKTGLCDVKCKNLGLELDLTKISILDTERDTVTYRSHNELNMKIYLTVVNKSDKPIVFLKNRTEYNPKNFKWVLKKDTIYFYNYDYDNKSIIKPNDSINFSIKAYFFDFYKLFKEKKDNTDDMLKLLTNFKLIYNDGEKDVCVNQDRNIPVGVYNDKTKWCWWYLKR